MASEIIIALVGLFCTTVSGVVTFMLTKRKYNTEVESQQITNSREAFQLYKDTMEENLKLQKSAMEQVIVTQNEKIAALQKENDELRKQVEHLQMQIFEFMKGNIIKPSKSTKADKK